MGLSLLISIPKLMQGVPYLRESRLQFVAVSSDFTDYDLLWGDFPCMGIGEHCSDVALALMKDNSTYIHFSPLFYFDKMKGSLRHHLAVGVFTHHDVYIMKSSRCLYLCVAPIVARQRAVYVSVWPPQFFLFLCGVCRTKESRRLVLARTSCNYVC